MNINPMQLMANPQEYVMNIIQGYANNNPILSNLLSLAQQGRGDEIEAIARNICREQGRDFDTEFNNFRRNMGL